MKRTTVEAQKTAGYIHDFLHIYSPTVKGSSSHTIKAYEETLAGYISYIEKFKEIDLEKFNPSCFKADWITDWISWLRTEQGCSASTCNCRLSNIREFLKFVKTKDVGLAQLYLDACTIPRQKQPKRHIQGLTKEAVQALLAAPDTKTNTGFRDMIIMLMLYCTAARIDELLSIKLNQLNLKKNSATVIIIGKGSKTRTLYLPKKALPYIRQYIDMAFKGEEDGNMYLFFSKEKGPYSHLSEQAVFKRLRKYAQIAHQTCSDVPLDLHAHQFRHARATHWLDEGINIVQISFLLGHENLSTTMAYLDLNEEEKKQALSASMILKPSGLKKNWDTDNRSIKRLCGLR